LSYAFSAALAVPGKDGLSAKFGDYCGLGFPNVCKTRARKC
jgi:hypothetical protein